MERQIGTAARGIRLPVIRAGEAIEEIVVEHVLKASELHAFSVQDRDIIGITESIVARAQGNYAAVDAIAADLKHKFGGEKLGIVFPILSRNRFSLLLKSIARSTKHVIVQFSYPSDEVGNSLTDENLTDKQGVNPWSDTLNETEFKNHFGSTLHPFTGIDYVSYYRSLIENEGAECTFLFSNQPAAILTYTRNVLVCDIHTRFRTKERVIAGGSEIAYSLDEILTQSVNGSGYNPEYGLLGSNKATEESVKLFPRDCQPIVDKIQQLIRNKTGKTVEVLIYGDGAFKDPVGKIWELADPVVSPAFTSGLKGTPNEVKLKYLADNQFAGLNGQALQQAIVEQIHDKKDNLVGSMESQGTTPRRLTDLIGSLCDLMSGSGDKGTPVVYIQGYFDSYATG